MAINIIEILGTDSIASSRITINNNFTEIRDKVDPVLDTYDTDNGVINISDLPNGQLIAKRLVVTTAGINVQGGSVSIGASSSVTLNGGNLELTTGLATFGGGISTNGITIANSAVIEESGITDFVADSISTGTVQRTCYVGENTAFPVITLQVLDETTEVFIVNDIIGTTDVTLQFDSGLFGNGADGDTIAISPQGTAIMKFIVPDDSTSGKWWYFGGFGSTANIA